LLSGSKGLSKLLSILIGLAVVIVAGIALTNSFYQYVYPVSIRPAVMIEYIDLVEAGDNDILILDLKNTGNVPVDVQRVVIEGIEDADCRVAGSGSPGSTFSVICSGDIVSGYGSSVSGILRIEFTDESSMALVFTAGRGQAAIIRTITDTITETETTTETPIGDFEVYFDPDTLVAKPGLSRSSSLRIISKEYQGTITLAIENCPSGWTCSLDSSSVDLPKNGQASTTLTFSIPGNAEVTDYIIIVSARDSSDRIKDASLMAIVQDFKIDVKKKTIHGKIGSKAQVTVEIECLNGYRGEIHLSYSGNVTNGVFSENPVIVSGQKKKVTFSFTIIQQDESTITITGQDEDGITRSDTFIVIGFQPRLPNRHGLPQSPLNPQSL